jgi:hypothetical protein
MKYSELIKGCSTAQDRIDKLMNSPAGLPEYNDKAHDAIRKVLGYLPDKDTLTFKGEYIVRVIIHGMEEKGEWDQEFLDNAIKTMFRDIHESEYDESVRPIN